MKRACVPADGGVAREGQILSWLATLTEGVPDAPLLPRVYAFDARRGMLALEWISDSEMLYLFHRRTRRYALSLARRLGHGLGCLHRLTRMEGSAPGTDFALVDALLWTSPDFYAALSPAGVELVTRVHGSPGAASALLSLRENGDQVCLLHGDLRQTNILRTRREVAFLDWELACWGDPARDVGKLLADYIIGWLGPAFPAEALSEEALRRFVRALLGAYAEGRNEDLARGLAFELRALQWAGEGVLHALYAETHQDSYLDAREELLADIGVDLLVHPKRWRARLLGGRP